ncbi:hypothetical protein Zmor_011803 [Zophobas morio]|uniref:Uncharacterized protein n=1 Tax=Zophobas morio TaxID=2755281 RepID=A0AA38HLK2_9CUCU|nr:hypothetical protein Zmor_011803 [Zophobas morio]
MNDEIKNDSENTEDIGIANLNIERYEEPHNHFHHSQGGKEQKDCQHGCLVFDPESFITKKKTKNKNLVYYIAATGVFQAVAIVASIIDIGFEMIEMAIPPINGIPVQMHFMDITVIMLAISVIGP